MRKVLITAVLAFILGGVAWAQTSTYAPWLFTSSQWNSFTFGAEWKVVSTELHQATGSVLVFYQHTTTGRVVVHLYRGNTGVGRCIDPTVGLPTACAPGMVIAN